MNRSGYWPVQNNVRQVDGLENNHVPATNVGSGVRVAAGRPARRAAAATAEGSRAAAASMVVVEHSDMYSQAAASVRGVVRQRLPAAVQRSSAPHAGESHGQPGGGSPGYVAGANGSRLQFACQPVVAKRRTNRSGTKLRGRYRAIQQPTATDQSTCYRR